MTNLILHTHLGLGDHLLCNAIVRDRARKFGTVYVPCYRHNLVSVTEMFSDLENVHVTASAEFIPVLGEPETTEEILGFEGPGGFNSTIFDQEFYRQAGIPFEQRWSGFKFPGMEIHRAKFPEHYQFVHDDPIRKIEIRPEYKLNLHRPISSVHPFNCDHPSILGFVDLLRHAKEIHCIDSSFAILADSLEGLKATRKVIHRYARPGGVYPTYRNNWEIIE